MSVNGNAPMKRRVQELEALKRPYAQTVAAQADEWRRAGSELQRAEVSRYVEQHGPTHVGTLSDELGLPPSSVRTAAGSRLVVFNQNGRRREVVQ